MAEQIITLGIGATPANLTPLLTSGLEIGEAAVITGIIDLILSRRPTNLTLSYRTIATILSRRPTDLTLEDRE